MCNCVRFMFLENMVKIILVFFKNCYCYLNLTFFMFFIFFRIKKKLKLNMLFVFFLFFLFFILKNSRRQIGP